MATSAQMKWHPWFAWYPITVLGNNGAKRRIWLKTVARRHRTVRRSRLPLTVPLIDQIFFQDVHRWWDYKEVFYRKR